MKFIAYSRALLIGLWLGAACFFSFAVAPSAFGILPSRELAGSLVSRTLTIVNISGLAIGVILILMTLIRGLEIKPLWRWTERFFLLVMTLACAVGQFVIGWWLALLRTQIGTPIDEVALDNPLRMQFDQLHQYSVWLLIAAMISSLIVFFIISGKSFGNSGSQSKDLDLQNAFID